MIISHKHKFIFIKTEKTAGTSIEIALSKYCGPNDIITPIGQKDEEKRQQLGYPGPQNYKLPMRNFSFGNWLRYLTRKTRPKFFNHISAAEVKKNLPPDIWNSYMKFCFERNPWDKVISWYSWVHKEEPRPTLSEFIQSGEANTVRGFELYTIDGSLAVDTVYRFEEISSAMADIARRLKLDEVPSLPRAKSGVRKDLRHYSEVLNEMDRLRIAKDFAREIEFFGYEW